MSRMSSQRADLADTEIGVFESRTRQVIAQTSPHSEHILLQVMTAMAAMVLVLMCVVHVDRVVVASDGKILPAGGSFFVQPLDRAMISAIRVRAGDMVRKGQVLADLDPTFATADYQQLRDKMLSARALTDRLAAEQAGRPYVATEPGNAYEQLQASIWAHRHAEYAQSVADFDARIASTRSAVTKATNDATLDEKHLRLVSQLEDMQRNLTKKGWGSDALVISAHDASVQAARQLGESRDGAVQGGHDLAALIAQRQNYTSKWGDDLATALVAARGAQSEAEQDYAKASRMHDLSTLVAPADAVVLNVAAASIGSVVDTSTAQAPLFTLTPLGGPLEADLHVDARDIGFIRPGDKVRLKLDAFRYTFHGVAQGLVKSVSAGSFSQSEEGQQTAPYFKVKVAITDSRLRNVPGDFRLLPGMTLSGDILEGGRTIMSYLLEGGLRTGSEAMREP